MTQTPLLLNTTNLGKVVVVDIEMTPQEYLNWGNDDNFVIQFIKSKL